MSCRAWPSVLAALSLMSMSLPPLVIRRTVHGIANAISGRSGDKNSESSAPAPAQSSNNGPELPASVPISETAPASTESETYPTTSPYASGVLPERYVCLKAFLRLRRTSMMCVASTNTL